MTSTSEESGVKGEERVSKRRYEWRNNKKLFGLYEEESLVMTREIRLCTFTREGVVRVTDVSYRKDFQFRF